MTRDNSWDRNVLFTIMRCLGYLHVWSSEPHRGPPRQDRVKICQRRVKAGRFRPDRVSDVLMTFESAALLALVIGLLAYLVAALIAPDKF